MNFEKAWRLMRNC